MLLRAERIPGTRARRLNPDGWLHYNVRVFIEGERESELDDVVMVVYVLDPSFEDERYPVSVHRGEGFGVEIWSYGFFDAEAKVLMKNGSYLTVTGEVHWDGPVEAEAESGTQTRSAGS